MPAMPMSFEIESARLKNQVVIWLLATPTALFAAFVLWVGQIGLDDLLFGVLMLLPWLALVAYLLWRPIRSLRSGVARIETDETGFSLTVGGATQSWPFAEIEWAYDDGGLLVVSAKTGRGAPFDLGHVSVKGRELVVHKFSARGEAALVAHVMPNVLRRDVLWRRVFI